MCFTLHGYTSILTEFSPKKLLDSDFYLENKPINHWPIIAACTAAVNEEIWTSDHIFIDDFVNLVLHFGDYY